MADEHDSNLAPTGVQIVSLPTPEHVQRAISDGFSEAMQKFVEAHALQPKQIIAGVIRWTWDYCQRNGWGTNTLGHYCERAWNTWEGQQQSLNRKVNRS